MNDRPFISAYSPQRTEAEHLEAMLVQREDLLRECVALTRESILTGNKHHLLFVGPRGMGKTHLVKLIHYRLGQQAVTDLDLHEKMRFAWLNEDEIATSFLRFLLLIYRSLSDRYPAEFPARALAEIAGKEASVAQEMLGRSLLQHLGGRTVVLIVENLDALFRAMPAAELLNWRAFVQNHPVFATVGTAQTLFGGIADRDEPFFGFFDTRHLEALSVDEARRLLENIARLTPGRADLLEYLQTPQGRSRVSAIHELSGGNPRLFVIFSELFTQKEDLEELVRPFEEMVDRQLTTYYQERLRWLSPQQREIVQLLSRFGHPVAVKQIAEGLFTTHNSITGQLKQLRDMRYVNFKQNGREVFYELAEPLMRLALQVKETDDRRPLALIVDFLRVAFEREEIEARHTACDPTSRSHAYFASARAANEAGLPNPRHEILRYQLESLDPAQCDDSTLADVRAAAEDLDTPSAWLKIGDVLIARKEWEKAVEVFTRVIGMKNATPAEVAKALHRRGFAHFYAGRPEEDIADCTRAIELPGAPAEQVAWAFNNRGFANGDAGRHEAVLGDFDRFFALLDREAVSGAATPDRLTHITQAVVNALFSHTADPQQWAAKITEFLGHFTRYDGLPQLGDALVQHLPTLEKSPLNHAAWDAWVDSWETSWASVRPGLELKDRDRLELPLRLLRTGIDYLKTTQEIRLLALPMEERSLLRKALGLPKE